LGRKKKRDTDVYDIVASNIKKFRIAAGITQEQLADKTLYAPEYIRRIESPKRKGGFSIEVVYGISKALEIGMEEFFKNEKESDNWFFFLVSFKP